MSRPAGPRLKSEERRVGKECRSRRSPYHEKKKENHDDLANSVRNCAKLSLTLPQLLLGALSVVDVGCRSVPANDLAFFFSSRRRHTRCGRDWSSDVCSSDLGERDGCGERAPGRPRGGTAHA